jgi:hypothetical protein
MSEHGRELAHYPDEADIHEKSPLDFHESGRPAGDHDPPGV